MRPRGRGRLLLDCRSEDRRSNAREDPEEAFEPGCGDTTMTGRATHGVAPHGTQGMERTVATGGGTLRFLGPGDPDHLDAASAYHARSGQIMRALTRQLFS